MCKYELPTLRLSKVILWQTDRQTGMTEIIYHAVSWVVKRVCPLPKMCPKNGLILVILWWHIHANIFTIKQTNEKKLFFNYVSLHSPEIGWTLAHKWLWAKTAIWPTMMTVMIIASLFILISLNKSQTNFATCVEVVRTCTCMSRILEFL